MTRPSAPHLDAPNAALGHDDAEEGEGTHAGEDDFRLNSDEPTHTDRPHFAELLGEGEVPEGELPEVAAAAGEAGLAGDGPFDAEASAEEFDADLPTSYRGRQPPTPEQALDVSDASASAMGLEGDLPDAADDDGEPAPAGGPSRRTRLSSTLQRIFRRKREQIGLTLAQVASISGVDEEELQSFDRSGGEQRLLYDHVVVISRVLGLMPWELPGLRTRSRSAVEEDFGELLQRLVSDPVVVFEGQEGERYGGPVDRLATAPRFTVKVGDDTLSPIYPRGALLAFVSDPNPAAGDVVLLRQRTSSQLALRRLLPPTYQGLLPWMPPCPAGRGEWVALARLLLAVPRLF